MLKKRLVHGIGVNDLPYQVSKYSPRSMGRKRLWTCPYYLNWKEMLKRCYYQKYHAHHSSYIRCTVITDWKNASNFVNWMRTQDWSGKQLDKDLLVMGNRLYGPETCVFLSPDVNIFLSTRRAARGQYMIGASINRGLFAASCRDPFKGVQQTLGTFKTEIEAHLAWQAKKHEHALTYAEMETDPRIKLALQTRYAPGTDWTKQ